ncbi:PREDICTED: STE20/SPS1-related proline-alanine-rich protein kinase isoform X1 [Nicotiana attenuata]|uniref:Serinethreonine-protein kinase blus1 n=1 Tax=Nicotiana attenuata TaxID=49451 RepID=A0A1J6IJL1_NICAT|nr:PREDICTED: STE20/SPS1-related proline-alanine-rich protein kinase isoform X1 [Nicotiana attenuata]OIT04476.1 serinethreonine-protein kinase blus1 [Nicotiana attenuata]
MDKKKYPIGPEHYTLYEEVGQGVSASVHRALCNPLNEVVAIKILDFERDNSDLNNISREAQTMVLVDHLNVLKSHCSFVSDHNLWVVMPYMAGGSCLHILKAAHQDGFEETVIATVLREVLKGLEYLHHHGFIHRDVKAGNILIDSRGGIKLGDFGVSAYLFDSGDRQRMRNTFVGTPCWMAPEVMEQLHGYDFKADIWSFGITALELAHGHAPFSKYPPMKVLLMTLQNAPPGLDYERDKKFSKSFKQMIASCLVKDPSKRPSAKKLLKHPFFKQARSNDYIARTLLEGLPALGDRMKALKRKEEDMLAQKKIPDGQKEEISQNEYKRGISSWNFNLEDLKAQASLIPDEEIIGDKDQSGSSNALSGLDIPGKQLHKFQHQFSFSSQYSDATDFDSNNPSAPPSPANQNVAYSITKCEKSDDDLSIASSVHEPHISQNSSPCYENRMEMNLVGKGEQVADAKLFEGMPVNSGQSDRSQFQNASSCNGASVLQTADDVPAEVISKHSRTPASSEDFDEKTKGHVVQQRGRFKVTSENIDLEKVGASPMLQKSQSMLVIPQNLAATLPLPPDATPSNLLTPAHFPALQSILEANIIQRESILRLMRQVALGDSTVDAGCMLSNSSGVEKSLLEVAHDKEKELISEITELQGRLIRAQEELQKYKAENAQNNS